MPLKVASYVLDGISYLATEKTMTDHALSLMASQDCALFRVVKGERICAEDEVGGDQTVAESAPPASAGGLMPGLADASLMPAAVEAAPLAAPAPVRLAAAVPGAETGGPVWEFDGADGDWPEVAVTPDATAASPSAAAAPAMVTDDALDKGRTGRDKTGVGARSVAADFSRVDDFVPAAGPGPVRPSPVRAMPVGTVVGTAPAADPAAEKSVSPTLVRIEPADAGVPSGRDAPKPVAMPEPPVAELVPGGMTPAGGTIAEAPELATGFYHVIGSFTDMDQAETLALRYMALRPLVLSTEFDGRQSYRVVVGPVAREALDGARQNLVRSGIYGAWAARINATGWTVSWWTVPRRQLAQAVVDTDVRGVSVR